jgi:dienelactone hydrolase
LTVACRCSFFHAPFEQLKGSALRSFGSLPFYIAALFALLSEYASVEASELVRFASAGSGDQIQGYLTLPKSAGPFPAVVLLHTCFGMPVERTQIGARIASWGYVALFVDDFTTRGLTETCAVDFKPALEDAYGALAYLARRSDVDSGRISAVGFSQGGDTALKIASGVGAPAGGGQRAIFHAAAAFYAPCSNLEGAALRIPTLILVGAKDAVTPSRDCADLAQRQAPGMAKLVVYAGAAHAFDLPEFGAGKKVMGMPLAFDRNAAQRSWAELRAFLGARIGR